MKLNPNSTRQRTSEDSWNVDYEICQSKPFWEHPWNAHMRKWDAEKELDKRLKKPNPPSKEAIERAKFVDKTYHWSGSDSVRSRDKRTTE
jgi:hypothetical protein